MPHRMNLHLKKYPRSKTPLKCEAMNKMFKPAVFNIQHLNSNREDFFTFIFLFCIKLQERLIKIQYAHFSKSYLKFWHVPELSHSVHRGINAAKKQPPPYFWPSPLQVVHCPIFRQFPIYVVFLSPLP